MLSTLSIVGVAAAVFCIAAPVKIYSSITSDAECQAARLEFEQQVSGPQHGAQLHTASNTDYFARRLAVAQIACKDAREKPTYSFLPPAVVKRAEQLSAQIAAVN